MKIVIQALYLYTCSEGFINPWIKEYFRITFMGGMALLCIAYSLYTVKKGKGFALCPRNLAIPVLKFIFRTVEK
jgi:hypothetical protein